MIFRNFLFSSFTALFLGALSLNAQVVAEPNGVRFGEPHFDLDYEAEGLLFLNISEEKIDSSNRSPNADPLDISAGERATTKKAKRDEDAIIVFYPAIAGVRVLEAAFVPVAHIALSPIAMAGNANEFADPEKFLSNRPVGRRGAGGSANNRELGSVTLQKFEPDERIVPSLSSSKSTSEKPELGYLVDRIEPYPTNLSDKENTNRPVGRTSGGSRGNSRQLYPAHPDKP